MICTACYSAVSAGLREFALLSRIYMICIARYLSRLIVCQNWGQRTFALVHAFTWHTAMLLHAANLFTIHRVSFYMGTVLPKVWPVRKIQSEYGASNYMAWKVKSGQGEGNPATPYPKLGHPLAPKNTCDFYKSDDVSRMMGRKTSCKASWTTCICPEKTIQGQISKGNHWVL